MANVCFFYLNVVGTEDKVKEFCSILNGKNEKYFGGIEEIEEIKRTNIINTKSNKFKKGNLVSVFFSGDCKWSVLISMLEEGYYEDYCETDKNITNLEIETKRLGLFVEVISEESGLSFMEHFIIDNGKILLEDCIDYEEYCMEEYESVEEFNKDTGENWTEEEFENYNEEYYKIGGIAWEYVVDSLEGEAE